MENSLLGLELSNFYKIGFMGFRLIGLAGVSSQLVWVDIMFLN